MKRQINFKERICECCNQSYKPTCATQKWCATCGPLMRKELKKKYTEEHKEEIRARQIKYYSDPKKREHKLEYNKERYSKKKDEINLKNKIYRENHKEEIRERNKRYRENHKEEIRIKNKNRREEHGDEIRKKDRERVANYTQEQKEAIKQYKKQYYEINKEQILQKQKDKRDANREEYRRKSRERYHNNIEECRHKSNEYAKRPEVKEKINNRMKYRRHNDVLFMLKTRMRKYVIRCVHSKRDKHTFDILNYTPEQLRNHLESQFIDKMDWNNYGTYWNIDHIKPLSAFNFFNEDGTINYDIVKEANALMNLRPILTSDNSIKGAKWSEEDELNYQKQKEQENA